MCNCNPNNLRLSNAREACVRLQPDVQLVVSKISGLFDNSKVKKRKGSK